MDSVSSTTGTELTRVRHILGLMQKNLECPICLDLLKNPVSTRCNHQFCRFCILKALTGKQSVSCPLCKEEVTKRSLQDNSQLQQIITAVQSVTEAVYKDTGQQKAPPVGSSQNCRKAQDQKEQGEKRRHISTDSEEGNGIPSTVQVRNRRNIRQAKRRRVEETPVYIEEDPVEDHSAPRTSTNINISCGFPVQEPSKGRKNRNVTDSPDRENLRRPTSRRTRHAARRDGRSSNRDRGSGQLEQTVASTELLSALVENSLGVTGDGHVTNGCHGDDDVTGNADPSAEDDRLLHVLGEASLGLLGQSSTENIGDPVAVCKSAVPKTEAQVGDKPLLSSHGHNADEGSREDDQRSDTLGPTVSEAEPLDISKEQEQMTVDLLTTEDEVPADIGTAVRVKEKVEFWLKHHSLHPEANNKSDTEPVGMDELDPYEFIGSQQDPAKEKKKPKMKVKKVRKPAAAGKRNQKTPTTTKMSSGPSKGKPGKSSAKQVEEVDGGEEDYTEQEEVSSAASMTDGSEASWKPGQSDPDWGKGRTSRRRSAEIKADEESVSSKGRRRKQRRAVDKEDQLTVSSGSSSQLRIDRWVQRKEKVFVKSYSKPALSRREKRLLQKKTEGLEEQWRRAKNMAGDFSAKVLHPIAEELPSKAKKKSKNKDTPLEVPVEETIIPQPDSPEKPSMGRREEVQNSDDDMCVYLTSNGELLNEPNCPEDSDGPTEDPDPEKQQAKEKSVALTDQEQKIAADLNELDEQTFSQLGMFSQQYLQKRKRRKDRKKRFEEEQDKDEDNIFAAIRALEGESNLCNNEDQDETSRKEAECMEVEDNDCDPEDSIPEAAGTVTVEKTTSKKSRQARSLSRDHKGDEDVTEEAARPRRTRSSTRKGTEDNLEKNGQENSDVLPAEVGNIGSKESIGQAPSTSKAKSGRKRQDKKGERKRISEETSGLDYTKDKCEDVTQDLGNEGVSKQPEEGKGRQQSATKERKTSESAKETETRQEDSVNIREAATKQNVSSPKTRKRHAAEEQTNMKPIGNVTESLGLQESRHSKTSEKRGKDDPKHLPLVTTKDKVPQDPYQFQCSQDCGGKKRAGKKRGRRQRGKVKKLKRMKARKRELLLIKAGWMEKEEDGEEELDESEEENVQEIVNKNNDNEEMVDKIHKDECKDAQAHLDKQEGGDQDTIPPEERINNTEVSVVPESNLNTQDTCIPSKRQGVVDLTASQPSYPVEDTPGIYSTEIIPPSLEEHQIKSPQAGKNKKKKEEEKTGEVSKLSTSGKVASQDTEDSEDIIGPSWQEKEQKQPRDKLNNKPENVQSPEEVQNIRRSPRCSPKYVSAKKREEDARRSVRHSSEKDKDGQQDILNSPRRRPRKPLEEQDLRRSPRHSTRKSLAGVIDTEHDAKVSRHSPEKDKNVKQNDRTSPRHCLEKALDQEKTEEEMKKIPTHGTEKETDKRKNKTGKQNLQPSCKEKRSTLQDYGNVVRNIPDTITLASPSPPRRNFAGVAGNTRSHRTGEGHVSDPRTEEEIFSSPGTQHTSLENSMEDCVAIPESETATEFEGKLVEVVADVHRLAEFSEGSQRTQTQNKLRKASSEIRSPGQHTSQRTPASLRSSGKDSTPGEVPPTPGEMFPTPPPPSTPINSSGQKAAADRNRLSTRRRRSQLRSPESTPSDHPTSPQNTPSTPGLLKSAAAGTKSTKSCATPTVPPVAVDSGKETPKSCPPESDVSTHCSQRTTQSDYREHLDSNVVPDSEENVSRKGKRRSSSMQNTSNSGASPKMKVTSPSTMLQQSFPDSGNTEASVSLLENVKLQTKGAETVSQQKRKSPRLSREVSDIDKNENSSREVTQKLEQTKPEPTNSGSHLKEQTRGGKGEDKADNMEPTENVIAPQATQCTFNRQGKKSEENKDQDLTEEVKQNVQVENNEQEIEDAQEEDGTEDEEDNDSEEEDLVPPTPPDTSFTQLTQRTMTVKSKPRIPERFDVQENNRQPVVIEEEENRECGWSDDDDDELPDLDDNHQVSPTCHSNTATPKNRPEKQPDIKEAVKESQDDISQATDTDINTRSQSKRRKETSGILDVKDEATEESLPKRRKSEGNTEPEPENKRNPIADAFDVTACLENNEESDLSQDSHTHDLTNASTLSELYDTQHQAKLKNDVQHLEGQMAMIQMLLAKGKERAREKEKEENNSEEQHLTTVHEENMQVSEGDQEEILSGKDLYGTPSSQASAKDIYSTAQEGTTPRKLRSSSTPTETNHSPTKEYNFRKRVSSPQRSQEASVKSQKSRRSQSSPRSSQPCLSPRSPSPPPTFSPEKTRTPRALPPAIEAAANLLEKFKSPNVSAEGKRRNSGNSTPLGKDDTIETQLSPRMKKGSTSPSDRKNTNPRSSVSSKKSNSKSHVSPRRKKQRGLIDDEGGDDDTLPVEDIAPTVKNRRSLNRKKSNSLKDVFPDEEDQTVTRCDDVPPASDGDENDTQTSGELRDDVCEPEEVSTNWKAFQQMKCDILAQKGPSPSRRQTKEAPKRLSLPSTQKSDKSSSDKRKSEPAIPSSQFDRNGIITENPSTPQPRKTPLTFSQQPSPSVRKPFQSVPSKNDSPRIRCSYKSPTDRTPKENTERMTSTLTEKSTDSAAGQTTGVKNEWQEKNHVPMTFVTTGLSKEETRAVHELAKKTGSRVKQTFDNSTTHVITRTDVDLFCSRTLKFFLGIAGRKWIVSFQWISACLEEGKHVPEEPFEVRGDLVHGCHGGPRQARNNKGKLLLSNYEICIYGKFTALTRDDLQFMVELCGGTVVKEPHMFPHDKKPLIVSQVDANQLTEEDYNAFYRRYGVLSVTRDWILDSVSSYQVQPISRYLMCSTQNQNVIVID